MTTLSDAKYKEYEAIFNSFAKRDLDLLLKGVGTEGTLSSPSKIVRYASIGVGLYIKMPKTSRAWRFLTDPKRNIHPEASYAWRRFASEGQFLFKTQGFPGCCGSMMTTFKDLTKVEKDLKRGVPFNTDQLRAMFTGGANSPPYTHEGGGIIWLFIPQRFMEAAAPVLLVDNWHLVAESSNIQAGNAIFIRDTNDRTKDNWKDASSGYRRPIPETAPSSKGSVPRELYVTKHRSIMTLDGFNRNSMANLPPWPRDVEYRLAILADVDDEEDGDVFFQIPVNYRSAIANGFEVCSHDGEPYMNGRYLPQSHFLLPMIQRNPAYDPLIDR